MNTSTIQSKDEDPALAEPVTVEVTDDTVVAEAIVREFWSVMGLSPPFEDAPEPVQQRILGCIYKVLRLMGLQNPDTCTVGEFHTVCSTLESHLTDKEPTDES